MQKIPGTTPVLTDLTRFMFTTTGRDLGFAPYMAITLDPKDLGSHESGWTIRGKVQEDYFRWVNEFEAVHPDLGRVWGDFEKKVHADTEAAFRHFYAHHPPREWDYHDI